MNTPDLLDALGGRGLLAQATPRLKARLAAGPITAFAGFDPTASSLHVGHLLPLMALRHLALAGGTPVALIGGGTALIGDPSGRESERSMLPRDEVAANAVAITGQVERLLGGDGRTVKTVNNADWLTGLSALDFLRDVGKHVTIAGMLERAWVDDRIKTGLSFAEFSCVLLQALDFVRLNAEAGVELQLGGADQWGNITAGIELARRTSGAELHGLTVPLLLGPDGRKFGKTAEGAVWLDPARTSPFRFFQFWLDQPDAMAGSLLERFTLIEADELASISAAPAAAPGERIAQRRLARDVTTWVHGAAVAERAERVSGALFGKAVPTDPGLLEDAFADVPHAVVDLATADAAALAIELGFAASRGDAARLIAQGGIVVNGLRVGSATERFGDRTIGGRFLHLRRGKRAVGLVRAA